MHNLTIYKAQAGLRHDTGPGHPERIARLQAIFDLLSESPFDSMPQINADPASFKQITRAHPESYVMRIEDAIPDRGLVHLDVDTVISSASIDAAFEAAGAACTAARDVMNGTTRRAFCAARPPGHHAEPTQAMGFCLFNNIFLAALEAQQNGAKRVAIVDFDVHHGNGSEVMARKHDNVLFISMHQDSLFPVGRGDATDQTPDRVINIPLAAGAGTHEYRTAMTGTVIPALETYKPDLILISAGFDAHRDDPLGEMMLLDSDYAWITRDLCDAADRLCDGRVISVMEGGYNLDALKTSARAHLLALADL